MMSKVMEPDIMAEENSNVPIPAWQKAELERREAEDALDPRGGSTWEEVKARLLEKISDLKK